MNCFINKTSVGHAFSFGQKQYIFPKSFKIVVKDAALNASQWTLSTGSKRMLRRKICMVQIG